MAPREFAPDRPPWEQQPGESDLMHRRFTAALDDLVKGLKLADVAVKLVASERERGARRPPGVATIITLAGRWNWRERARLFAEDKDSKAATQYVDARAQVIAEHLEFAKVVRDRVALELKALPLGQASHTELARWLDVVVKIERQALGLDIQRHEMTGPDGKPLEVRLEGLDAQAKAEELAKVQAELVARQAALSRADADDAD